MMDDLARPLGQNLPRRTMKTRGMLRVRLLPAAGFALILGGSAAIVLLQPQTRRIDVFAEAEVARIAAAAVPVSTPPQAPLPTSPKIVAAPLPAPQGPTISYPPDIDGRSAGQLLAVRDPGSLRQPPEQAAVPDESLIEPSSYGPLPIRGPDGRRPFDVYSTEASTGLGTRVAIIVGGLGISQTGTQAAIARLPAGVTLAFSPAGNSLDRWMKEARRNGHEILLQAPMEPFGYPQASPGPHTVTAQALAAGDFEELHRSFGRLTNYVGVMNYMGARITADPAALRPFISELARRGLLFLDDASSSRSLAKDMAHESGAVFAGSDVLLDGLQEPGTVAKQLESLERIARADGTAIGIASAFDTSVEAIAAWIEEAEARGVSIVPVSALANDPESR
ncbi:MAG: divergent polysaccharide deacetylase family protein [Rhizobiaceae bacterium]|nr:divergent polysaccharide deacetylase family protein [Rhizobiaceae bacterium]